MAPILTLKLCAKVIRDFKKKVFSAETISYCRKSPTDFVRKRKLDFPTLILFLFNFVKGSIQDELDHFFKTFLDNTLPAQHVVSSALCQARNKLIPETFQFLGKILINSIYENLNVRKWKSFRLVAVDGSTIKLPDVPIIREIFHGQSNSLGCFTPMAKVLSFYDPLNKFTLHSTFNNYKADERFQLFESLDVLDSNDLILLDRGFPAFWLFSAMFHQNLNFLCRVPIGRWNAAQNLIQSGASEMNVTLYPDARTKKKCKNLDIPITPLVLRIVRVDIKTNHPEVLLHHLWMRSFIQPTN